MKTLLINIRLREAPPKHYPPTGLAYIATALKLANISFDLLDLDIHPMTISELDYFFMNNRYDVVAMGCIVTGYHYVKDYAKIIKKHNPETVIIVGNTVGSSIPDLILRNTKTDIVVLGEGDETIVELINCLQTQGDINSVSGICYLENGVLKVTCKKTAIDPLDNLPYIDWSIFEMEEYIRSYSKTIDEPCPPMNPEDVRCFAINITRGCPFHCSFCFHAFREFNYRRMSTDRIINEMRRLHESYGINLFYFMDDLSFVNAKQADELAGAILDSRMKVFWTAYCRSGTFTSDKDLKTLEKMKQSGALAFIFSLESGSPEILDMMNKKATADDFIAQAKLLRKVGIVSKSSLVFGYPLETPDSIRNTIDCCLEAGVYPSVGFLLPQPGTPIFDWAIEQGKIADIEKYLRLIGDRQDFYVNFTNMTDYEFQEVLLNELQRLSDGLGIGLTRDKLIKTNFQRMGRKFQETSGMKEY